MLSELTKTSISPWKIHVALLNELSKMLTKARWLALLHAASTEGTGLPTEGSGLPTEGSGQPTEGSGWPVIEKHGSPI